MLMQLQNTFLSYSNVSGALHRMKLLSEAIQSTFSIYSSYNWFFIHLLVCILIHGVGQLKVVNLIVYSPDQNHVRLSMYFCF